MEHSSGDAYVRAFPMLLLLHRVASHFVPQSVGCLPDPWLEHNYGTHKGVIDILHSGLKHTGSGHPDHAGSPPFRVLGFCAVGTRRYNYHQHHILWRYGAGGNDNAPVVKPLWASAPRPPPVDPDAGAHEDHIVAAICFWDG